MRDPAFWWRKPGPTAALLSPVGAVYGAIARQRMTRDGARAGVPVICVGNFTLGGAGKTPTAIALAKMLAAAGRKPFFLTRGYGGSERGPHRVDPQTDSAARVGDEALLLAQAAPTVVSRDRVAGAALAKQQGADVIIMDDGLQNAALAKDFTLAVIDGRRGVGNGFVFPAGPLRAPFAAQIARSSALFVVGDDAGAQPVLAKAQGVQTFRGKLIPDTGAIADLKGRKVLAFAGIGDPEKFFATVAEAGAVVASKWGFTDHHVFTAEESSALAIRAERGGLTLITTEKDRARMRGVPHLAALAERVRVLPVTMEMSEPDALQRAVMAAIA